MAVLETVTLQASTFFDNMECAIATYRNKYQLATSDIVSQLIKNHTIESSEYGNGVVITQIKTLPQTKNYSKTSSLLTTNFLDTVQEQLVVDNYKMAEVSTIQPFSKQLFLNGETVNTFIENNQSTLVPACDKDLYDAIINTFKSYTPTQASQTLTLQLYDVTRLTDPIARNSAIEYNAKTFFSEVKTLVHNMAVWSNKYTDNSEITTTLTDKNNFLLTFNDRILNNLKISGSSLFHGDKISIEEIGIPVEIIPSDQLTDNTILCYLSDRQKFALTRYYNIGGSFHDVSNMVTNNFFHWAYGAGVFKGFQAVVIKVDYINKE